MIKNTKNTFLRRTAAAALILLLSSQGAFADVSAQGNPGFANFTRKQDYAAGHFADVRSSDWFAPGVQSVYELGLMNGKSAVSFAPNDPVKLSEAISMAAKAHHIYQGGNGVLPASEAGEKWYSGAVNYAISENMIKAEDFMDYDAAATKGQLAYLYAAALPEETLEPVNAVSTIPDVTETMPYGEDILKLYRAGIVSGSDSYGTYHPEQPVTRGEAASILSRIAVPQRRQSFSLTPEVGADLEQFQKKTIYLDNTGLFSLKSVEAPWTTVSGLQPPDNALHLQLLDQPAESDKSKEKPQVIGEIMGYISSKTDAAAPLSIFHSLTEKSIAKTVSDSEPSPAISLVLSNNSDACFSALTSKAEENSRYWILTAETGGQFVTLVGRTYLTQPVSIQNEIIDTLKSISFTK